RSNAPHTIEQEQRGIVSGVSRHDGFIEADAEVAAEPGDCVALVREFRKDIQIPCGGINRLRGNAFRSDEFLKRRDLLRAAAVPEPAALPAVLLLRRLLPDPFPARHNFPDLSDIPTFVEPG